MLTVPILLVLAQRPMPLANPFPFVIPWDDAVKGTATDVSFLNSMPAGKNGRIVVRNGHFVEEKTGTRVRFFGTNAAGAAAFPDKKDADKIAAHMAKLGINLVRLHHLNNGWDTDAGRTVWKKGRNYLEFEPANLHKLDYFVAALKRHGIYVNVNLQTAREYLPEMGLPATVRQIPNFGKKVDKFFDRMIVLQQEYAKGLLDRVNPYTKLKYKDDPAVAIVEINNENSLVGWPGESPGAGLAGMPPPFPSYLRSRWNEWLLKKYGGDAAIKTAWRGEVSPLEESLINSANNWSSEKQSGDAEFASIGGGAKDAAPGLNAEVKQNPGPDWHVQAHISGLNLINRRLYTVSFLGRSEKATSVGLDARLDQDDWHFLGLSATVPLTPEWKRYSFTFRANQAVANHSRVGFVLGASRSLVQIRDLRLQPGSVATGLGEDESAESGTVPLPTPDTSPRFRDYTQFLLDTERAFSERMRTYLQKDLGFSKNNIIDSQIAWGGLTSLDREQKMEFADNHAYWNHPTFLGKDWDTENYRVTRAAMVDQLPNNFGSLSDLARFRVVGKPYSISEYCAPAPSDFQIEMMPEYAAYAAAQDWDAIYTFAWEATGTGVSNDMYNGFFDMPRNPAKLAFFPSSALIFRKGLVLPNPATKYLQLPARPYEQAMTPREGWAMAETSPDPLTDRTGLVPGTGSTFQVKTNGLQGMSQLRMSTNPAGKVFIADSPSSASIAGFVAGSTQTLGVGSFKFGGAETGFGALTLVPVDGKPVLNSEKILITLGSRVENVDMAWNGDRNSVSNNWGKAPVQAEPIACTISLKASKPRVVYTLSPTGIRLKKIPATYAKGRLTFSTKGVKSMWIEVAVR